MLSSVVSEFLNKKSNHQEGSTATHVISRSKAGSLSKNWIDKNLAQGEITRTLATGLNCSSSDKNDIERSFFF